ncbi:MAG: WD40/YVTN/BNR-like repeat-containing protein [Haloarculaceae archaeon]
MLTHYAALDDYLVVATGEGADRRRSERLSGHDLQCLAAVSAVPERVFCGTFDAGLQRSTDGGDSWERVGVDVLHERVMSVTVSPHDPDVVWAGTEPSAIFVSRDGGDTWTERPGLTDLPSAGEWYFPPRPDTHHVRWIDVAPDDPDRLYVGIEAGAFVTSPDGGDTWRERLPGSRRDNHSLATHSDAPGRVYAAAGDGYAESHDHAADWAHPQSGLDHRYCWSVVPTPGDPDVVVLTAASDPGAAHSSPAESYVYRREGDGDWERAMAGLPDPEGSLRGVLAAGDGPGEVHLLSNHGLYRTTDSARTWSRLPVPWRPADERLRPRGLAVV